MGIDITAKRITYESEIYGSTTSCWIPPRVVLVSVWGERVSPLLEVVDVECSLEGGGGTLIFMTVTSSRRLSHNCKLRTAVSKVDKTSESLFTTIRARTHLAQRSSGRWRYVYVCGPTPYTDDVTRIKCSTRSSPITVSQLVPSADFPGQVR